MHEAQKGAIGVVECLPDDPSDPLGCGFYSDDKLKDCPFCGKGGDVVAMPKAPPADAGIEANLKLASTKKGVAKVTSKDVKNKKKERGEPAKEDKPEAPSSTAIANPEATAIDLPSESAGGSAHDLDRIAIEIDNETEGMLKRQALSMWEIGRRLTEIRDKKLWSLVRTEDGNFAYPSFNSFVAQRFDFSPDHASLMIRVGGYFSKECAEIGIAKAKYILDASDSDDVRAMLVAYASEKDEHGNFVHSALDLRSKIKRMKNPELTEGSSGYVRPTTTTPDHADDESEDADRDDDERDDSSPESSRPANATKPAVKPVQMTSVPFEKKDFCVPLAIKGSQVKPAKKIQDEPHGTLHVPGGTKIHFVVVIGDDGQLAIEGKIETPY